MIYESRGGGDGSGWLSHYLVQVEGKESRQDILRLGGLGQKVCIEVSQKHSCLKLTGGYRSEEVLEVSKRGGVQRWTVMKANAQRTLF